MNSINQMITHYTNTLTLVYHETSPRCGLVTMICNTWTNHLMQLYIYLFMPKRRQHSAADACMPLGAAITRGFWFTSRLLGRVALIAIVDFRIQE